MKPEELRFYQQEARILSTLSFVANNNVGAPSNVEALQELGVMLNELKSHDKGELVRLYEPIIKRHINIQDNEYLERTRAKRKDN